MNLVMKLAALVLVLCPALANAQFQKVRATVSLPERLTQTKVCDTSAFPPFNRLDLCNVAAEVIGSCHISASMRAKEVLPAPMLRRALLRMIEEFEAGAGVEEAVHSALELRCEYVLSVPG